MTQMIRAIPTRYKGYHMRSRLEARWAVLFNELDVQWDYEPEGFVLPSGARYLPDFWLPKLDWRQGVFDLEDDPVDRGGLDFWNYRLDRPLRPIDGTWVEVKAKAGPDGRISSNREFDICREFAVMQYEQGHGFAMVVGPPEEWVLDGCPTHCPVIHTGSILAWQPTGRIKPASRGRMFFDPWGPGRRLPPGPPSVACAEWFRTGVNAARSARFEHGESGAT